jgi:hypothetical protein
METPGAEGDQGRSSTMLEVNTVRVGYDFMTRRSHGEPNNIE